MKHGSWINGIDVDREIAEKEPCEKCGGPCPGAAIGLSSNGMPGALSSMRESHMSITKDSEIISDLKSTITNLKMMGSLYPALEMNEPVAIIKLAIAEIERLNVALESAYTLQDCGHPRACIQHDEDRREWCEACAAMYADVDGKLRQYFSASSGGK